MCIEFYLRGCFIQLIPQWLDDDVFVSGLHVSDQCGLLHKLSVTVATLQKRGQQVNIPYMAVKVTWQNEMFMINWQKVLYSYENALKSIHVSKQSIFI